ncbi:MAG: hypothetical protein KJN60_04230, partial [Boseongicola sp.]|nr:hypothetical protein [Boseongicola sp.]
MLVSVLRLTQVISEFARCCVVAVLLLLLPSFVAAEPSARLIHFTEDGTENGAPLLPGFAMHSVWSGMGQAEDGRIYIAVSNHDELYGNVALFALDPGADRMRFLSDIRSVSEAAGNWLEGEGAYKVHTFLERASDGRLYFATMPATQVAGRRGAHLYSLDPTTETIEDVTATSPYTVTRDAKIVAGRGVLLEELGIKGLGAHPDFEDMLYMMAYDNGALLRYDLSTGTVAPIGHSPRISYAFHVDGEGDVYYLGGVPGQDQAFLHFDAQSGETTALVSGISADEEVGMIVPTANPDLILVLLAKSKEVFPVHTKNEKRLRGGTSCGQNWWRLFNMAVSPDGKDVYFVSNNNRRSAIWRAAFGGAKCAEVLDVDALLGSRNLAFG